MAVATSAMVLGSGVALSLVAVFGFGIFAPRVPTATGSYDIRVTKGFGTRAYNKIRISVVSTSATPPTAEFFDYSDRFMYKWRNLYLHTALKEAVPGATASFDVGTGLDVRLPRQGSGVAGVFIADPCVNSPTGKEWVHCTYGESHQTIVRTPALINAFVGHADTDFWGVLGDNFYDRTGEITRDFFGRISAEAKSKVFVTVPGNHDYWVYGYPELGTTEDQCGNGHMQYYAQDTKAAVGVEVGSAAPPFNFSVAPDRGRFLGLGCNLPAAENAFWYSQLGNIGLVGQSSAYTLEEAHPFMLEACAWLGAQPGLELAVLVGHWDTPDSGAAPDMAMPQWYTKMAGLPGCLELDRRGVLKFFTGHTHCNTPHPGGASTGFRVAGFGMGGCGNFGVPVLDTSGGRARIWYFDTSTDVHYSTVLSCVRRQGWRRCKELATLWLDQPIGSPSGRGSLA